MAKRPITVRQAQHFRGPRVASGAEEPPQEIAIAKGRVRHPIDTRSVPDSQPRPTAPLPFRGGGIEDPVETSGRSIQHRHVLTVLQILPPQIVRATEVSIQGFGLSHRTEWYDDGPEETTA